MSDVSKPPAVTSNERLLKAAKALSKVLPKGLSLQSYHAIRELMELRAAIDSCALSGNSSAPETSCELERLRELQEKALALDDAVAEFGIDKPQYIAEAYQKFHDVLHDGHGSPSVVETKPKPTIEGLERLLQAEDSKQVYVWPDGYVHDTPPPEKAPEAHIDYNVPGCDCLGCELAPKTLVEVRAFGTSIDPPSQKALAPRYELPLEWQAREWTEIDSPSSLCGLLGCNRQTPHHHKAAL